MALAKTYDTVGGRIRAENSGGSRTGYLPDALGSVTATVDGSGAIVNTYRYKPYGELLAKTGAATDPKFCWTGTSGSRKSFGICQYNRMRQYLWNVGLWSTCDVQWPREAPYVYVQSNPSSMIDPSGLQSGGYWPLFFEPQGCPHGSCGSLQPALPRPSPAACNPNDPEITWRLEWWAKYAYCQARVLCKGEIPPECKAGKDYIPPERYGKGGGGTVNYASTYCCYDCSVDRCVGRIVPGEGWNTLSSCEKLCTFEHEYTHARNCQKYFKRHDLERAPDYPQWTECQAWCNNLACLLKILKRGGVIRPNGIVFESGKEACGPWFGEDPPLL